MHRRNCMLLPTDDQLEICDIEPVHIVTIDIRDPQKKADLRDLDLFVNRRFRLLSKQSGDTE
ncbi:MAG: hypothetical protein AAF690_12205 [Acidobacteriota bacterium]